MSDANRGGSGRFWRLVGFGFAGFAALVMGLCTVGVVANVKDRQAEASAPIAAVPAQAMPVAVQQEPEATVEPMPTGPQNAIAGDGTYLVGKDIVAGTYRGNVNGSTCYWERLSGLSGELGDTLANEIAKGPAIVAIKATDKAFTSKGCGRWELAE